MTAQSAVTPDELAALLQRVDESASAYMRGEVRRYLTLVQPVNDCTLMPPTGGGPIRDHDASDEAIEATSRFFQNGDATFQLTQSYVSTDLVVLAGVERQHGEVGGTPDQDWSLRVTLVFRREGANWRLVHRHADPLVHAISLEQAAALARGIA